MLHELKKLDLDMIPRRARKRLHWEFVKASLRERHRAVRLHYAHEYVEQWICSSSYEEFQ